MAASNKPARTRLALRLATLLAAGALLWLFPPFRIVPSASSFRVKDAAKGTGAFDAAAAAAKVWTTDFPAAAAKASDLGMVAEAVRKDPAAARTAHARQAGLGGAYYFVKGKGRVVAREGSRLRLALDEAGTLTVELRVGPVFGNTVRDGCGLLDVNAFPGLQEFNALSAELNRLIENQVLPLLREKAQPGVLVEFVACAEAPESVPSEGAPVLTLIPIKAELH